MWEGFKAGFMLLLMSLWEAMKQMGLAFKDFFMGFVMLLWALVKALLSFLKGMAMGLWDKFMGLFGK